MRTAEGHRRHISGKQVAKYVLLPGFWPRIRELIGSGFVNVAYFLALVYGAVGLLPRHHAYLNSANKGRFGIRHVVAQAANQLTFKRENIDQIIIFFTLFLGLVILLVQCFMLAGVLFISMAHAAVPLPTNFGDFFLTDDYGPYSNDIAFVLLDRVFGVENVFLTQNGNPTCVAADQPCFQQYAQIDPLTNTQMAITSDGAFPWPFHYALHTLFEIYSIGLLVVAMLIFSYFVITVAVETAQSGTPFGRRFNHVWAPIRLVVALGLLVPVANGLNSAQYITLYAAKFGSGFATNGWNTYFLDTVAPDIDKDPSTTPLGDKAQMVATPNEPDLNNLLEFAMIVRTCVNGYEILGREIKPYLVRDTAGPSPRMEVVGGLSPTTFQDAAEFYDYGDILVRWGEYAEATKGKKTPKYRTQLGFVAPVCGDLLLTVGDMTQPGVEYLLEEYWKHFVIDMIADPIGMDAGAFFEDYAEAIARCEIDPTNTTASWAGACNKDEEPKGNDLKDIVEVWRIDTRGYIDQAVNLQRTSANWGKDIKPLGWGGAAIWYNKVAEINGALIAAVSSLPVPIAYPAIMEEALKQNLKENKDVTGRDMHRPFRSDKMESQFSDEGEPAILRGLVHAYSAWTDVYEDPTGYILVDAIKALFGVDGLYDIRDNPDIHPLAQLVTIGRSLVESSVRNFGFSMFASVGGGLATIMGSHSIGSAAVGASDFLWSIAMLGLGLGFVLFYIIPFLPFIYFFFAVGGWVKGIFEAMVGVPLWALAHLRIDGNGFMGDAAVGGYYLILEIFLRPILIVFALIASIQIFSAQVDVLHHIWSLVTSSVAGFNEVDSGAVAANETGGVDFKRDVVDDFFYTCIYAIIIYMLGLASFKLINLIPNQILRWMGASVSSFGDTMGNPADNMIRNTYIGTGMLQSGMETARGGVMQPLRDGIKARAAKEAAGG